MDIQDTRTIEVIVRLTINADADIQEVISEMDYDFSHEAIQLTEIIDVNTEF
jgi:hypothetical protein